MFKYFHRLEPLTKGIFSLLIGFAVITFWRGVWGVLDVYVLSKNYGVNSMILIFAGIAVLLSTHHLTKQFS